MFRDGGSSVESLEALAFVVLWSSAAVAAKIGLRSAPPLTLLTARFAGAGLLLLAGLAIFRRPLWPGRRWKALALLGLLNTTLYLGASFVALTVVPAGLFNLFVATNPFLVLVFSRFWLKTSVTTTQWTGFFMALTGLVAGSWSGAVKSHTPLWGIMLIILGMMAMAAGSLYFQHINIPLPGVVVNTWQLLFGVAFLCPVAILASGGHPVHWNLAWWGSLAWLVGAVSIGAMLLWFHLLQSGAAKASMWLLLTPIIGYGLAAIFLREPFTVADGVASGLVVAGLAVSEYWAPLASAVRSHRGQQGKEEP